MNKQTINYMLGAVINDWTVIAIRPRGLKSMVLARCVCGKVREVRGRTIRDQTSKNCGCKKADKVRGRSRIAGRDGAKLVLYSRYKRTAKRFGRKFDLSFDEFIEVASTDCFYCGLAPSNVSRRQQSRFFYNGIDRVDNRLGYENSNVVACCTMCNTHKGAISIDMAKKIISFVETKEKDTA